MIRKKKLTKGQKEFIDVAVDVLEKGPNCPKNNKPCEEDLNGYCYYCGKDMLKKNVKGKRIGR